jgi:ADP-ribose pyrophosphatase YjhB (NUDIX family)
MASAVVPFHRDDRWYPLNPGGRTGRTGRNLGKWGENAAADPIVITGDGSSREVLLILRDDCGKWAIPGGHVDPGEAVTATLARELLEETGVDVSRLTPEILTRALVDDPRNTDHAWISTVAARYHLPEPVIPHAGTDAADARWWPADGIDALTAALTAAGEELYPAHLALLTQALAS